MVDAVTLEVANILQAWRAAVAHARSDLVGAMVRVLQSYFEQRGRLAEGLQVLRPALLMVGTDNAATRARVRTRQALSLLHFRAGDLDQSQLLAEAPLEPATDCGERVALIGCLLNIGNCLLSRGQVREALDQFERALQAARDEGDRHGIAVALGNIGIAEKRLGNLDRALEHYRSALAAERELGNEYAVAIQLNNLGALMRSRDPSAALTYLQEGIAHCRACDVRQMLPFFQLNLGLTELDLGQVDGAFSHLLETLEHSRAAGQLQIELSAELALSDVDVRRQQLDSALQRLRRVAATARATDYTNIGTVADPHYVVDDSIPSVYNQVASNSTFAIDETCTIKNFPAPSGFPITNINYYLNDKTKRYLIVFDNVAYSGKHGVCVAYRLYAYLVGQRFLSQYSYTMSGFSAASSMSLKRRIR